MPPIADLAIAAALAWGSGLRLYATLLLVGLAGFYGWIELPSHLAMLQNPMVLWAAGFMTFVEFFVDKFPWVDSLWDSVHTFIRIPAGAVLAAAVFGDAGGAMETAAAILGGTIAGGTHFGKLGARAMINSSPEPFSNWAASFTEDAALPAGLWLATVHPMGFLAFLIFFAVAAVVLARWIVKGLVVLFRRLRG